MSFLLTTIRLFRKIKISLKSINPMLLQTRNDYLFTFLFSFVFFSNSFMVKQWYLMMLSSHDLFMFMLLFMTLQCPGQRIFLAVMPSWKFTQANESPLFKPILITSLFILLNNYHNFLKMILASSHMHVYSLIVKIRNVLQFITTNTFLCQHLLYFTCSNLHC